MASLSTIVPIVLLCVIVSSVQGNTEKAHHSEGNKTDHKHQHTKGSSNHEAHTKPDEASHSSSVAPSHEGSDHKSPGHGGSDHTSHATKASSQESHATKAPDHGGSVHTSQATKASSHESHPTEASEPKSHATKAPDDHGHTSHATEASSHAASNHTSQAPSQPGVSNNEGDEIADDQLEDTSMHQDKPNANRTEQGQSTQPKVPQFRRYIDRIRKLPILERWTADGWERIHPPLQPGEAATLDKNSTRFVTLENGTRYERRTKFDYSYDNVHWYRPTRVRFSVPDPVRGVKIIYRFGPKRWVSPWRSKIFGNDTNFTSIVGSERYYVGTGAESMFRPSARLAIDHTYNNTISQRKELYRYGPVTGQPGREGGWDRPYNERRRSRPFNEPYDYGRRYNRPYDDRRYDRYDDRRYDYDDRRYDRRYMDADDGRRYNRGYGEGYGGRRYEDAYDGRRYDQGRVDSYEGRRYEDDRRGYDQGYRGASDGRRYDSRYDAYDDRERGYQRNDEGRRPYREPNPSYNNGSDRGERPYHDNVQRKNYDYEPSSGPGRTYRDFQYRWEDPRRPHGDSYEVYKWKFAYLDYRKIPEDKPKQEKYFIQEYYDVLGKASKHLWKLHRDIHTILQDCEELKQEGLDPRLIPQIVNGSMVLLSNAASQINAEMDGNMTITGVKQPIDRAMYARKMNNFDKMMDILRAYSRPRERNPKVEALARKVLALKKYLYITYGDITHMIVVLRRTMRRYGYHSVY